MSDVPHGTSSWTHKSSRSSHKILHGVHRFEHWRRDNQMYFITARCRNGFPAFASEAAKSVFWDRFEAYTQKHQFTPWITSLIDNHYHTLGYCKRGESLGEMMRCIHGSVAKLVNDLLAERRVPFWRGEDGHDYFDGCLRDETQCRRTYRYIMIQPVRHGICEDWREYPHTRIRIELETGLKRATELNAFLRGVRYKRYDG